MQQDALNPNGMGQTGDPRIIYDPASGRYFASEYALLGTGGHTLLAVSNDSNPLNGFRAVAIPNASGSNGDFPTLGVSTEAVTLGANDTNFLPLHSSLYSIPKQ